MADKEAKVEEAKVEEAKAEDAEMKDAEKAEGEAAEEEKPKEPEKPKELEEDAVPVSGASLAAGSVGFLTEDTTLNVMPTVGGKLLMCLSDGGFQYLLAGARANTGIKAGRYMFEVMIAESKNPSEPRSQVQGPRPRQLVKVGLSTADSSLFLADGLESVCFDSEGFFIHGKTRQKVSQKFSHNQVVAVVLNLDPASPNADTVSLFRDGVRVAEPQPLPEALKGKVLYPAVTYRNVTLQVNFGATPLRPLPFKCLTLQEAAVAHCEAKTPAKSADGKQQVVMPIGLPDEGTFDWLDKFLSENKGYVEISDRAIFEWALKSGVQRQGGYAKRTSNDKPEPNFGLPLMDDLSVSRVISAIAPALQRNYVVMEVKGNLLMDERKALLARFNSADFKKVAQVAMGEPPADFKSYVQELMLKEKTVKAEAEAKRKKAEATRKKLEEEKKRKAEEAKKKRIEDAKKAREAKEGKKEGAEEESKAEEDTKMEEAKEEEVVEEEIKVELTEDEKKLSFRKKEISDLTAKELALAYSKFTLPDQTEGFDAVTFMWQNEEQSKDYLRTWMLERKLTQRVEELEPSDWFKAKWTEWTKLLNSWKRKQQEFKDPVKRKAALAAKKKAQEDKKKKAEEAKKAKEEGGEEAAAEEPEEPEKEEAAMEINAEDLDVFGVEDVMDIGNGEPLLANFVYEDWQLLSLRFELHLLVHAFKHDLDDPERPTFHESHLSFYYSKYYKKSFNLKYYGVAKLAELIEMMKDTMEINSKTSTLESQLSDDTPMDNFVKLTEDHRRDRQRRLDAGDETAKLQFTKPPPATAKPAQAGQPGKGTGRPGAPAAPTTTYGAQKRPYAATTSAYPPAQKPRTTYGGGSTYAAPPSQRYGGAGGSSYGSSGGYGGSYGRR
mmetsp:Transcript_48803/g.111156  ORF Transcript_48803/g.111156 Transcript_48803/m.111156 type:complete len:891 (-) Transcript_48803:33-2705(-)